MNEPSTAGLPADSARTGRRLRNLTLLTGVLLAALVLLSATGDWFVLQLGGARPGPLAVPGAVAVPAQSAFGIASLALIAALALAGPVFRIVFGVLQLLLALCIVLGAWLALADPVQASASIISAHTGIAGMSSLHELVDGVQVSWPAYLGIALGVLAFGFGVLILFGSRRWPQGGRRYESGSALRTGDDQEVDWDALSRGLDPTTEERSFDKLDGAPKNPKESP